MQTNPVPTDEVAATLESAVRDVPPLLSRAADQASALAQRGLEAVREGKEQLRDKAQRASEGTVSYIKDEPVKAMLIAAATGAALMALIGLLSRSNRRD